MRRICYIIFVAAALATTFLVQAQEADNQQSKRRTPQSSRGVREKDVKGDGLPELTVRARDLNDRLTQVLGNARWMRVIYRQIDLTKEENAPLYYPVQPINGQMNLFSTIFQLVSEGKLPVYEYIGDYEDFSDDRRLSLKDMLDRFHIFYEEVPAKGNDQTIFVVNEADVPAADVKSYYIKEAWFFDQNNSVFDVKTLAVCPIMTSNGDIGETTMPMFWILYENLRPYVMNSLLMTSNTNNAMTFTIDDYFRRRMFKGDIIKTQNLMNQPLQAYCPTPDSLQREQERIEYQLASFEKNLFIPADSMTFIPQTKADKKAAKKSAEAVAQSDGTKENTKTKTGSTNTVKQKTVKTQSGTPVRSVRRSR